MSDEKEKTKKGNEEKEEGKENGEGPENKPVPEDKAMEDALEDPDKAHRLLEAQIEDTETVHKLTLLCREDPVPMDEMRKIAVERGLVSNRNRKKLWPKLLGINRHSADSFGYRQKAVKGHQDANTVAVDVERSAWLAARVTGDVSSADTQLKNLRRSLQRLINGVVCSHPGDVFYYQGFHDVAAVVMLIMGEDAAYPVLEVLAMHHLRDCSRPSLELVMQYLKLFFPLLRHEDLELFEFLKQAEKEAEIGHDDTGSHFAVPWVLTWFAHAMSDLPAAARLFDFFLCTDPTMPLYYSVVMLKHNRDRILTTRCDYAELRALMSNLPAVDQLEVRELITKTIELSKQTRPPRPCQLSGAWCPRTGLEGAAQPRRLALRAAQVSPDQLQAIASLKLPPDSTLFTYPYMWMSIPVRKDAVMRKIAHSKARFEPATGDMAGWGTYLYPNGNRFRGSFNQQKRHGLGQ
ncbi:hypothetical protein CYMTET_40311 [Cymbomonas tetramitiformis]|uniref:Rab-GAP TBC domain-containing protein n=1 Tax=Cymbomonas tetramitiformis TaxID=36881 RepID=A0AAE0CAE5_9CHLO|nr:hypothetical protein CYMTET_40311 [Cymbomonas tetramitiformis]